MFNIVMRQKRRKSCGIIYKKITSFPVIFFIILLSLQIRLVAFLKAQQEAYSGHHQLQ
jgi:hypothetical protein